MNKAMVRMPVLAAMLVCLTAIPAAQSKIVSRLDGWAGSTCYSGCGVVPCAHHPYGNNRAGDYVGGNRRRSFIVGIGSAVMSVGLRLGIGGSDHGYDPVFGDGLDERASYGSPYVTGRCTSFYGSINSNTYVAPYYGFTYNPCY